MTEFHDTSEVNGEGIYGIKRIKLLKNMMVAKLGQEEGDDWQCTEYKYANIEYWIPWKTEWYELIKTTA